LKFSWVHIFLGHPVYCFITWLPLDFQKLDSWHFRSIEMFDQWTKFPSSVVCWVLFVWKFIIICKMQCSSYLFFFFWASSFIHCLAALDFGAGVEQPFSCLIVQNHQVVQSMGRSMDWTLEDDMVDGLFFCATLTGRRGDHTPFAQAGAETSDTGAEAVKLDPGSSWEGHSGVGGCRCWWSPHCAARMLLLSEKLMSCCSAGTNGCLDLRRREFAFNGRMIAEWSRCPGFLARRPRDSVSSLWRSSAGWCLRE